MIFEGRGGGGGGGGALEDFEKNSATCTISSIASKSRRLSPVAKEMRRLLLEAISSISCMLFD